MRTTNQLLSERLSGRPGIALSVAKEVSRFLGGRRHINPAQQLRWPVSVLVDRHLPESLRALPEPHPGTPAILRDELDPAGLKGATDDIHCRRTSPSAIPFELAYPTPQSARRMQVAVVTNREVHGRRGIEPE